MRLTAIQLSDAVFWTPQMLFPHGPNRILMWMLCLLSLAVAPVSANETLIGWLRGFATPQSTSLQRVGESLNIQGTDTTVLELRSARSVRQIELFYNRHWRAVAGADQIHTEVVAEWRVLSMVTNDLLTVLQLRDDGSNGAYGFLSARQLVSGGTASPVNPFAGLVFTEQSVGSQEQGRESRVFTMRHSEPPKVAALAIRHGLVLRGWRAEMTLPQPQATILNMRRGADVLEIVVLAEHGGTIGSQIVAHFRTDDE